MIPSSTPGSGRPPRSGLAPRRAARPGESALRRWLRRLLHLDELPGIYRGLLKPGDASRVLGSGTPRPEVLEEVPTSSDAATPPRRHSSPKWSPSRASRLWPRLRGRESISSTGR